MVEFERRLEKKPGTVILRGRVEWVGPEFVRAPAGSKEPARRTGLYQLQVWTPIESYFVSERKAPQLDRLPRDKYEMAVDVVVAEDGRSALKQLYVRGVPAEDFEPPLAPPGARPRD
jgi:hypothetical protein